MNKENNIKGGGFLLFETDPQKLFIPEEWNEEEKMVAQMCQDFLEQEVNGKLDAIDALEEGLMPSLLEKAGEQGLLGISLPEEYGGLGKDFRTSMLVTEKLGAGHSFAVAFAAHTGIGTLPILYYGTKEQKEKYLPKLASGEWKGAYCLTEPDSGSDANAAKSRAKLSEDGKHYILNGQKMWITNGGFADVFIVFAKIDDDAKLSAFIVEESYEGISLNPEEKKMGIKGSSTRQVFFNDCKVPVENLLAEREQGFKIAVNILNLGRIKLGGAALGACKSVINKAVNYSKERIQFGIPIQKFGAIRHKIGEQAVKTYATESATYRASHDIQLAIERYMKEGMREEDAKLKGMEEFAIEAAIIKVHASEALDYVVDEGVQIYGGMGYSAEAPMERSFRDARINRIFEGTNEINRLLSFDMMVRKGMKGELPLLPAAQNIAKEMMEIPDFNAEKPEGVLALELERIQKFKKAILLVAGAALQKYMQKIAHEQELIMYIADMLIETYVAESTILRVQKLYNIQKDAKYIEEKIKIAQLYTYDAGLKIQQWGTQAIASFASGDEARMMQMALRRFTKADPLNTIALRREIADKVMEENAYCYS
ncbi:MAG TPA: acyl-CoA dehydrogenase family protein [Chitinophagaceae bacterium]|nr:acyl-CoA dehydrogenase family protein [Chitinophagaceae bacterium]